MPSAGNNKPGLSDAQLAALEANLRALWNTSRPVVIERVERLRAATDQLLLNASDDPAIAQARETAHKLAGILGVFGLKPAGQLASRIDGLLSSGRALEPAEVAEMDTWVRQIEADIAAKEAQN